MSAIAARTASVTHRALEEEDWSDWSANNGNMGSENKVEMPSERILEEQVPRGDAIHASLSREMHPDSESFMKRTDRKGDGRDETDDDDDDDDDGDKDAPKDTW